MTYFDNIGIQKEEWKKLSNEMEKEVEGKNKVVAGKELLEAATKEGEKNRHDFIKAMMFGLLLRK